MPYSSSIPDPYIDTETGVLKNLLGISSTKDLEDAEADITAAEAILKNPPHERIWITHGLVIAALDQILNGRKPEMLILDFCGVAEFSI